MRVLLASLACVLVLGAAPAHARSLKSWKGARRSAAAPSPPRGTRIAVQPIATSIGPSVRNVVTRILQARGVRVLTSLPPASGTSQYPGLASEHRLAGFVVTDVTLSGRSANVTFLVWNSDGSVIGRWSVWASEKKLYKAIGKGFWKSLGPAISESRPPPSSDLGPAPTLRIDAGSPLDEPLVSGDGWGRGRAPILR